MLSSVNADVLTVSYTPYYIDDGYYNIWNSIEIPLFPSYTCGNNAGVKDELDGDGFDGSAIQSAGR